jgi:hypothetical protein
LSLRYWPGTALGGNIVTPSGSRLSSGVSGASGTVFGRSTVTPLDASPACPEESPVESCGAASCDVTGADEEPADSGSGSIGLTTGWAMVTPYRITPLLVPELEPVSGLAAEGAMAGDGVDVGEAVARSSTGAWFCRSTAAQPPTSMTERTTVVVLINMATHLNGTLSVFHARPLSARQSAFCGHITEEQNLCQEVPFW